MRPQIFIIEISESNIVDQNYEKFLGLCETSYLEAFEVGQIEFDLKFLNLRLASLIRRKKLQNI